MSNNFALLIDRVAEEFPFEEAGVDFKPQRYDSKI